MRSGRRTNMVSGRPAYNVVSTRIPQTLQGATLHPSLFLEPSHVAVRHAAPATSQQRFGASKPADPSLASLVQEEPDRSVAHHWPCVVSLV
jgi:hypothetical protein